MSSFTIRWHRQRGKHEAVTSCSRTLSLVNVVIIDFCGLRGLTVEEAHHFRTIHDSGLIIVLGAGSIAESGTQERVVDRVGLYSKRSAHETLFTSEDEKMQKPEFSKYETDDSADSNASDTSSAPSRAS
ncbi:predicted protein [Pyrenophora tritici-repentis Pt-1C-BFP]|uniref:Uncharacterized protein n=1 Tax=Pyrenophora tritici-repentis (strain Pt-1C-BFP) TaxID=426418 RepID=B2VQR4_PYRTR|nr:uncharacterized protein PTRG_00523 [Pyrenophora tritici-repentis Pt-1C-BFP]EDU39961.1 predicted protein [Pyrenophora tritici-repentis Pt-1C-BFP]